MFYKNLYFVKIILLLIFSVNVFSATLWDDGGTDSLYSTADNWNAAVPNGVSAEHDLDDSHCVIDSNTTATPSDFLLARVATTAHAYIDVTGGSLTVSGVFCIGGYNSGATDAIGELSVSGGTVTNSALQVGKYGTGILNVTGGVVDAGYLWCPRSTGTGIINLDGGTILATDLDYGTNGTMDIDITKGVLILDGNEISDVNTYITNGWLTAYDGDANLIVDYNGTKTTVYCTEIPPLNCDWTDGGSDELWSNPDNWDPCTPRSIDTAILNIADSNSIIESETINCESVYIGTSTGPMVLDANNATINISERFNIGGYSNSNGDGTLILNDTTVNAGSLGLEVGKYGTGTLTMSESEINTPYIWCPRTSGTGKITFKSGTINITDANYGLLKYSTGTMDIDIQEGIMVLDGNQVSDVNSYISSGWIKAYKSLESIGIYRDVIVDYNGTKTIVSASYTSWTGNGSTDLWTDPNNWRLQHVPTNSYKAVIDIADSNTIIDSNMNINCESLHLADTNGTANLNMTGGTFTLSVNFIIGGNSDSNGTATFNISSGTVNAGDYGLVVGKYGSGTINMTGGTINTPYIWCPRSPGGIGKINLYGGTINITDSGISTDSSGTMNIDITEGTIVIDGFYLEKIRDYVESDKITAYGGLGEVLIDYDYETDKTTISASNVAIAHNPEPADEAFTSNTVDLYWSSGIYAADSNGHDVYFGTDYNSVANANHSSSEFKGTQDSNSYDPGSLSSGATYYWAIDEVNGLDVWVGDVWSFTTCQGTAQSEYYVATDGNDLNSGDANNPFATIEKARDTIRNSCSLPDGGVTVWIRGGTYYIDSTIVFDEWDSGEPNNPIVYKNYPDESPVLIGGELITGWTLDANSTYKTYVGTEKEFYCLFENGNRSTMARIPNSGYFETESRNDSYTEFGFDDGNLPTVFDYNDAQVYCWPGSPDWNWYSMTQPITDVNWDTNTITIERGYSSGYNLRTGNRCFVQGAKEFLDSAGEFHLNQSTGWLYYWPVSTPIADQNIIIPTTNILIQFKGSSSSDPIKYVTLDGLELGISDFGKSFVEDASWREHINEYGLVVMENAAYNTVKNCKLVNAGLDGVLLEKYAQNNTIYGNLIENTGRHGVNLSGWLLGTGNFSSAADSYVNKNNLVSNNLIYNVGKLVGHGSGINVYQSGDNEISHNKIYESPRMGICVTGLVFYNMPSSYYGVSVTYANHWDFLHSKNNEISYNDVSDYGNDSQDLGGIYTWATGKDNDINNNWVHDARSPVGHCAGIYLDDNSDYVTVTNNIIHDIGSDQKSAKSLYIKGNYNIVTNNIIAFHDTASGSGYTPFEVQYWMAASEAQYATWYVTFERNILYQPSGQWMFSLVQWDDNRFLSCDNNIYYHPGGSYGMGYIPGDDTYTNWLTLDSNAYDQNSLTTNPLFEDPNNRNFDLEPNSPAFNLGIVDIDDESIGLKDDFLYDSQNCSWDANGNNELWSNKGNWDIRVPRSYDDAIINVADANSKIETETISCNSIFVGPSTGPSILDVNNATVNTDERLSVGGYSSSSGNGTLILSNSTINAGSLGTEIGKYGTGTLNMMSGTINTSYLWCPRLTGTGTIYLDGGTINITDSSYGLLKYSTGTMDIDITEGTMIIDGNQVSDLNTYITNGWITAYDGSGTVIVDYNSIEDKTTMTGTE